MSFPTAVRNVQALAVEGDFASANPHVTVNAGPGGLVAAAEGVLVGRFGWLWATTRDTEGAATIVRNTGFGVPSGFIRRSQQALITTYLAETSMTVPQGFPLTLFSQGDFWVKNNGATQATPGMKAYADFATGAISFAATGAAATTAPTASIAAATAISMTGSISGDIMTITAVSTGTMVPGAILSGASVTSGTQVTAQLTGTAGGVGTYRVIPGEQTVTSTTISGTYGTMTVTVAGATPLVRGGVLSGSGVTSGTVLWDFGTGAGGIGTYRVSPSQTASSTTITETTNVETKWVAQSEGAAAEIVKMSSWLLG